MIQNLKKIIFIMLIFVMIFSSFSIAAGTDDWDFSEVQYDQDGKPYIVGTDKYGNEHTMTWDENNERFSVMETTTSGTGQQQRNFL